MKTVFSMIGILMFLILGMFLLMMFKNKTIPNNLGVINGKLADMPKSPNAVSSQTEIESKKVASLKFNGDINQTKNKIVTIVRNYGGTEIITNERNYIHIVFKTPKVGFKDDVEFYFDEKNKLVHYRSASRVGYSDMGMNRKRYEELSSKYYMN